MADTSLLIEVGANVGGAVEGVQKVHNSVTNLGGAVEHAGKQHETFFAGITHGAAQVAAGFSLFEIGKGAVEGLVEQVKGLFEATNEDQAVQAQLNAVLASTGGIAGVTAEAANKYAEALSETTRFSKQQVLTGEDLLLTFTHIGKEVFPDATKAMLDMATALHEGPEQAARQLGKALQDPEHGFTALRKVGILFTDSQKEQIKAMQESGNLMGAQKIILGELAAKFGDSAHAAGTTFAGSLDILGHKFEEIKIKVGEAILPKLTELISWLASPAVMNAITGFANILITGIGAAITFVSGAINFLVPILTTFGKFISDNLIPVIAALAVVIGPPLIAAIIAVGTTLVTVAIPAAIATVTAFFPIIALAVAVGAAVALLKLAWDNNFLGMRDILKAVGDAIGTTLGWIGDRIKDFMRFLGLQVDDGKKAGHDLGIGWVDEAGNAVEAGQGRLVTTVSGTVKTAFDRSQDTKLFGGETADSWLNACLFEIDSNQQALINECATVTDNAFNQAGRARQAGINTGASYLVGIDEGLSRVGAWAPVTAALTNGINYMNSTTTGNFRAAIEQTGHALQHHATAAGAKLGAGLTNGIKKGLSDALSQVTQSLDVFNKGMEVLGKLRGFQPVAIESLDAFFNSLDAFTVRAKVRLQSYVGNFDEFKAKFAAAMGDTLDAIGKAVAPLQAIANINTLPNALVLDAFFDALDAFVARAQVRLQSWVGNFDDFRAKFANAMGDTLVGIGKAIEPLAKLGKIDVLPSAGIMDAFFDALDLFVARAVVREQEWVNNFDEFKAKFAGYMGDTLASISKVIEPLSKLAQIDTLPGAGAINAFFDALNEFINAFTARAADWSTKITAEVALLAGYIGGVAEAIGKIVDPLLKLPQLQKISPEAIEGAMANIWLALHHFNEVMKSGELQGGRLNEMVAFANGVKDVFVALTDAITFLTDKANPASIVAIWRTALNDMFTFAHNVWAPQTLDMFKVFFNTMTEYFNSYTSAWVATWVAAINSLTPPPLPGGTRTSTTGGGIIGGIIGHGGPIQTGPVHVHVYLDTQEISQSALLRQQLRGTV